MPKNRGMDATDVRNWLGLYVLILTAAIGAYFFVAPRMLVPLERPDQIAAAEILTPFLLGQVAAVFRFYSSPRRHKTKPINIPRWVVKVPPALVSILLGVELVLMGIGGVTRNVRLIPDPDAFKALLTFCVALLNASTVFVITRYFEAQVASSPAAGQK